MKYEILQIKRQLRSTGMYAFMDYNFAKNHDFTLLDYDVVYKGEIEYNKKNSIYVLLDELYEIFNIRRPEDFKGHSMSVSDVIRLEDGRTFYVDSVGYAPIE